MSSEVGEESSAGDRRGRADPRGVGRHIDAVVGQLAQIIAQGAARGEFQVVDPTGSARAVWDATCRFHDPQYAAEWRGEQIHSAFASVCALILTGLGAQHPQK